jgi:hypothetical protein
MSRWYQILQEKHKETDVMVTFLGELRRLHTHPVLLDSLYLNVQSSSDMAPLSLRAQERH